MTQGSDPRPSRNLLQCALLLLLAGAARGQVPVAGSFPAAARRDTQRVPVVLTISGGASLGSYEAGVTWGLVEVFKLTARDSLRRAWNLPRYDLQVTAGASAGTINGFLAALEWCRTRAPTAPERSLFWKVWVRTGFDQLFPLEHYTEDDSAQALFSRRYFEQVLLDTLGAAMENIPLAGSPEPCAIPVGVTITRVAPESVAISRTLYALTQRSAAVALLSRRGATLEFRTPADLASKTTLGALLLLPDCDGVIARKDVFRLIEASSAFPAFFPPVFLRRESSVGSGCGDVSPDTALFTDGGLFDNNPVDLAAAIYDEAIWKNPHEPDPNALLVFIDPDRQRGRLAHAATSAARLPVATGGIAALLDLFAGAVPAARQYELQAFGRLLARAPAVFAQENIKSTDRGFFVVGQRLGSFGAFLGKPFREYDFYVGIYDALTFFAGEACQAAAVDALCIKRRLQALVETRALDLGSEASRAPVPAVPLARQVVRLLYQREWQTRDTTAPLLRRVQATAPLREGMVLALVRAHFALEDEVFDNARCRTADAIVNLLCHDGFRRMLRRFASDIMLRAIRGEVGRREICTPSHWLESPVECDADQSFETFVANPERFMADKLGLMLHQLWRVERTRKRAGEEDWAGVAAVSEVVFQSGIAYRYRRGLDANTSSLPSASGKAGLTALIPNYASFNVTGKGFDLGYRPTLHLSNSWALAADAVPLELVGNPASTLDRYRWVIGPALHWKRAGTVWSGLETGIEVFGRWRSGSGGTLAGGVWSIPVSWYVLADKVRLGIRVFPGHDSGVQGGPSADLSVGLSDLNGLAYWLLRR